MAQNLGIDHKLEGIYSSRWSIPPITTCESSAPKPKNGRKRRNYTKKKVSFWSKIVILAVNFEKKLTIGKEMSFLDLKSVGVQNLVVSTLSDRFTLRISSRQNSF